ncbi:MAG: EpsG family protein [Paludibacteraceae bacterium]|nr:EpsG family protein [Paludibacteraceae bacterium]
MYLKLVVLLLALLYMFYLKGQNCDTNCDEYDKRRLKLSCFIGLLLILQSGLRHISVGPDTYNYYNIFCDRIDWEWKQVFEHFVDVYVSGEGKDAGFSLIIKLFSYLSKDYQLFLVFVAFCIFAPLMRFLYLNTSRLEDLVLALYVYQILFYGFFSVTGIRQTIATGFCLTAYEYVKSRNLFLFLICIFAGALIHKSCLLFLPFYWIANINSIRLLFAVCLCSFPLMAEVGRSFTLEMAILSGSDNYLMYAEEESKGAINLIIFYFVITLGGFYNYWNDENWISQNKMMLSAISIGIFFLPLTLFSANLVRIVQYFSIFLLVYIGSVYNFKGKGVVLIWQLVVFFALLYKLLSTRAEYYFFWENVPLNI